ncbi:MULTISPECIES: DUF1499 domain-containing protein [Sphingomonas]|uniref:DUF1499 domain-containing protein n=1 Tax=Sphingomonas TaxID=13687 RepID=UPI0009EC9856|nr:DUF1499 domain-containing protein [Sphingomonas sp. CCH10-B3]MBA3879301.1 DUF1499 domain-containing protein [Sphingobium sp.]
MAESLSPAGPANRTGGLARLALLLSGGGLLAAIVGAVGTGSGSFGFKIGLLLLVLGFLASSLGGLVGIVALVRGRRSGRANRWSTVIALAIALVFGGYFMAQLSTALRVPPIHDITTNLADVPQFTTLAERADNFAAIPGEGDPAFAGMDARTRWAAIHRTAYGDLQTLHLPLDTAAAMGHATRLVQARGWAIAKVDAASGIIEATDTSLFFRFRDDVIVRIRPDLSSRGGAILDMRSVSRVGESDIGVNAKRIRAFLADMKKG